MKKIIALANAVFMLIGAVLFLFIPVFNVGDDSYNGLKWLAGYQVTTTTKVLGVETTTTTEYFLGKPVSGILLMVFAGLIILLSVFVFLLGKKNMKYSQGVFALILVLSVVCVCFSLLIHTNSEFFGNYGSGISAAILFCTKVKLGAGAYVFFSATIISTIVSFFGTITK
jgi:hypothetical protein